MMNVPNYSYDLSLCYSLLPSSFHRLSAGVFTLQSPPHFQRFCWWVTSFLLHYLALLSPLLVPLFPFGGIFLLSLRLPQYGHILRTVFCQNVQISVKITVFLWTRLILHFSFGESYDIVANQHNNYETFQLCSHSVKCSVRVVWVHLSTKRRKKQKKVVLGWRRRKSIRPPQQRPSFNLWLQCLWLGWVLHHTQLAVGKLIQVDVHVVVLLAAMTWGGKCLLQ